MNIRLIKPEDYENLIAFWKEHYFVNEMDDLNLFKLFLIKNPGLSLLAEENGLIIGTVLGSFDGRRGYIQKLVVHTGHRRRGLALRLIQEVVDKLHAAGALYIPITVEEVLVPLYAKCGFKKTNQTALSISWSTYNYHKGK